MANEVFATVTCPQCSEQASLMVTSKGKSRYWYSNGCECGCNQTTGASRQRWLVENAQYRKTDSEGMPVFASGEAVPMPPNVKQPSAPVEAPKQAKEAYGGAASADFGAADLEAIGKPEAKHKPIVSKSGKGIAVFAVVTVVCGLIYKAIAGSQQ